MTSIEFAIAHALEHAPALAHAALSTLRVSFGHPSAVYCAHTPVNYALDELEVPQPSYRMLRPVVRLVAEGMPLPQKIVDEIVGSIELREGRTPEQASEEFKGEGKKLTSIEDEYESAESALRRAEASGNQKEIDRLTKLAQQYSTEIEKKVMPAPVPAIEKPTTITKEVLSSEARGELQTLLEKQAVLRAAGKEQEAKSYDEGIAKYRQFEKEHMPMKPVEQKPASVRPQVRIDEYEARRVESTSGTFGIPKGLGKKKEPAKPEPVENPSERWNRVMQEFTEAAKHVVDNPERFNNAVEAIKKATGYVEPLNPDKTVFTKAQQEEFRKSQVEAVRMAEEKENKEEPQQEVAQPIQEQPKRRESGPFVEFIRSTWENSRPKFKLESLYDTALATIYDKVAGRNGELLDAFTEEYERRKRQTEELEKIAEKSGSWRAQMDVKRSRTRMLNTYGRMKQYETLVGKWESKRDRRCHEIVNRIDIRLRPYEEQAEDCGELFKDAEYMLKKWNVKLEELTKELAVVEAEGKRMGSWFGLVMDPETRKRADKIRADILAVRSQILGRNQYMDKMNARRARAEQKAESWRTRKEKILLFGRSTIRKPVAQPSTP